MNRVEYRDHWLLSVNAAMVLRALQSLLNHPALDISPTERLRYEMDAQALSALLPPTVTCPHCGGAQNDRTYCCEALENAECPF